MNDALTLTDGRGNSKRIPLRIQIAAQKLLESGEARTLDGALVIAWIRDRKAPKASK